MSSAAREDQVLPEIGKYQLVAELARGGMGNVYLAALQGPGGFNKLLVVKELKPDLADDDTYVSMFLEEARLAARLIHPNIVQTNEVGSEGKRHFMVMEFLDGRSLHRIGRRLTETGRLTIGSHLRVISDALRGLQYAHDLREFDGTPLGIVHRDVSPLNIFVTFDGQAKVLDFGIAKTADSSLQTATGVLKGRVAYMAPEQAWGNKVDRRADVYAVGVMIWEAAAGRRLWPKMSEVEILARCLREGAPTLRSVRPDAPSDLEEICARAMAKDCEDRYPSADALLEDLEAHLVCRGDAMSMREIGSTVAHAFADERKKMAALIEKTLTRMRGGPRSGVMPTFEQDIVGHTDIHGLRDDSLGPPSTSASASASTSRVRTPTNGRGSISLSLGSVPSPLATSSMPVSMDEPRAGNLKIIAMAGASAFAISAVIFGVFRSLAPPAPAPAAVAALPAAAPAVRDDVELVDLVIRVAPPSAQISIDGAAVSTNPFHARYRKDRQIHHILASADGYDAKLEDVIFAGDVAVDVSLDRHVVPPPRKVAPPPPPPAPLPFHPAVKRAAPQPSDSPPPPPSATAPAAPEVSPAGGHAPLRPIVTASPYGNQ
jgi:eukaryotic-like serine/threonine-protein kinase